MFKLVCVTREPEIVMFFGFNAVHSMKLDKIETSNE